MVENQYIEDEIDLREIVLILWKRKNLIISLTLILAFISGIFSMFVLPPVFETNLNIVINMPEKYNTRFGEYALPITTNEEYLEFIRSNDVLINTIKDMDYKNGKIAIEKLKKRITILYNDAKSNKQNSFNFKVTADNPEESLKLAETLYDNYIEFLDVMTKERAIKYYYNDFTVHIKSLEFELDSAKEILTQNEALLTVTPQTINQKEALKEISGADFVVLENIINPNYTKLESDIIINKQTINDIENSIRMYKKYLEEIESEKKAIDEYYQTGKAKKLDTSIIGVVETSIYLPSPPVAPTEKTSPSNAKNVLIGGIFGLMLGVMIVFVKDYWWVKKN